MGALLTTRQNDGVEEVDIASNHVYRYPPRSGNYFASHFIMGGERFDTPQPESYLFGENSDLNFLGSRPTPFPYPPPQPNEPTKTLKSLVNIRKESLKFVRVVNEPNKSNLEANEPRARDLELGINTSFNIEFVFDCDVSCAITIYHFCTEELTPSGVTYVARDPSLTSETFYYNKGANQHFYQTSHIFNPAKYADDELLYDIDKEIIPIAIHCVAEEGSEDTKQSHTTIAVIEKVADGSYILKALKQKLFVDGLCYLLQEIYGIENKNNDKTNIDDDTEDNGSECVICMCEVRDTLILPCRHLCLCNSCADSLRYQANNCPICRAPFRALLQIRALQKSSAQNLATINPPDGTCDNIPPGYEAVSLIEALNGPCIPRQPPAAVPDLVETPENEHAIQAAQILNRQCDLSTCTENRNSEDSSPECGVSGLKITSRHENKETSQCPLLSEQVEFRKHRPKDSVRHVNEKIEKDENIDEDSEAENLSPLLQKRGINRSNNIALHMADVVDSIDDMDTDQEEPTSAQVSDKMKNYNERGDESDYYTPDEPVSLAGPLYDEAATSSKDSTPQRFHGTPHSYMSVRSSVDSSTSGSSTRHLLTVGSNNNNSHGCTDRSAHV